MARRTRPVPEIEETVAAVPTWFENKAKMINHVLISNLDAKAKVLLLELIMRRNPTTGQLNPGTARLAKARGIKDTKNFKGLETYLPGLVNVHKTPGKKNSYSLNDHAIMALPEAEVKLSGNNYNPPSSEGYTAPTLVDHPSLESNHPAVEGYYPPSREGYYHPSTEGSNSKEESKLDSKEIYRGEGVTTLTSVTTVGETDFPTEQIEPSAPTLEEIDLLPLAIEDRSSASHFSAFGSGTEQNSLTRTDRAFGSDSTEMSHSTDVSLANRDRTSYSSEINPGYSSVTTEEEDNSAHFHVYNETVTSDSYCHEATDAPVTASQAVEVPEVPEIPERPVKPVERVPGRSQYDTDMSYQKKIDNSRAAHLKAMGKWKQDMNLWEAKYGDNPVKEKKPEPKPLSPELQERLDRYKKYTY